ncbi:aggregation-promoting factor C-terminal-like domain-containing protein [Blastococcus atacamensis]|uniref:aggregation-promoting factor C-terminal-like domain-containing protein n=1 Tax=Blastococcus atacamensis TaxID=2070508 RepID=UPI0018E4D7CF|nr:transglycosylase SLT domain-containing protein [Blastococcus atacamensis]
MNLRLTRAARPTTGDRRSALQARRPALLLAVAAAGALMVNVVTTDEPAAQAEPELASVSVAEQLGISEQAPVEDHAVAAVDSLGELAASRSERQAEQDAALRAQAAADQAELDRRAAEEAARVAAEQEAARVAAEQEAARAAEAAEAAASSARPGRGTSAPVAPAGSYQDYAMSKLGGSSSEFGCLEKLWGKESGWNPNAQNPSSTAYGIAQFLDSTWKGTGIAKTSDGYRQIDAGLIYIENRFGSPCGAWSHSQAKGWY